MPAMDNVKREQFRRWGIRLGAVTWFVTAACFLLALPVVLQIWIWMLPVLILAGAILSLPVAWLWRRFAVPGSFWRAWLKAGVAIIFLLSILTASPVYYFAFVTQLKPALIPQVTLTNGDKRIVFQGMQHVGSARFYENVVFDLEDALSRGYVLFYEGVSPSTPANDQWFAQTITNGRDLTSMYRDLGEICGLRFQNDYLKVVVSDAKAHPNMHVVADVSTADLKLEYDRLLATDARFAADMAKAVEKPDTDHMKGIIGALRRGTVGQREIAGTICRGFMTTAMRDASDPSKHDPLDPLILDFRNRVLAQRLIAEQRHHIYVTYGDKHLPGVFSLLKQQDPRWHMVSVKWLRTIDSPENYSARLPGLPKP